MRHELRYRVALLLLDLGNLPGAELSPLWGCDRRAPISFRREDYFGDCGIPLDRCVRDLIEQRTGTRPGGPVHLLTSPRVLGYSFNPISLYYCYDAAGRAIEHVIAEVTNTPWLDRYCYVLTVDAAGLGARDHRFVTPKQLHVSPFFGMDQQYRWCLTPPGERLSVHIANEEAGRRVFDAVLDLEREPLTRGALLRSTLVDAPLGSFRTIAAIHWQALRLWCKGAAYHPYPHVPRPPVLTECPHAGKEHRAA